MYSVSYEKITSVPNNPSMIIISKVDEYLYKSNAKSGTIPMEKAPTQMYTADELQIENTPV